MFYVYILKCKDGSYYTGHTDNLKTREEAFAAERKIKGWCRKKKEALIMCNWSQLSKLAKKKF
jgi:putative endonuclease